MKNKVVRGITDADGGWVGICASLGGKLLWDDREELECTEFGFDGEQVSQNVQKESNTEKCVTVDGRDVNGIWNIESCKAVRRGICELSSEGVKVIVTGRVCCLRWVLIDVKE